jgi:hypothetical protein
MIRHQTVGNQIRPGQYISIEIEQELPVLPVLEKDIPAVHSPIVEMINLSSIK